LAREQRRPLPPHAGWPANGRRVIVDYHLAAAHRLAALAELDAACGGGVPGLVMTADHGGRGARPRRRAGYPLLTKRSDRGALRACWRAWFRLIRPRRAAR